MKCSYCDKEAEHYAFWHRETPRPVINSCPEHFSRMAATARKAGEEVRRLHPDLALEHEAAIIQTINGSGKLHVMAMSDRCGTGSRGTVGQRRKESYAR